MLINTVFSAKLCIPDRPDFIGPEPSLVFQLDIPEQKHFE